MHPPLATQILLHCRIPSPSQLQPHSLHEIPLTKPLHSSAENKNLEINKKEEK
jgi:hypothetical protein